MKIFSVAILFFISFQVCGQDSITHEFELYNAPTGFKIKYGYYYQGERYNRKELKKLIFASEDSLAIHYYKNHYQIPRTVGIASFWSGLILLSWGTVEDSYGDLDKVGVLMFSGVILFTSGIILKIVASRKKSINRFNSIQQSNLKVDISRNGIGLRYNF